MANDSKNPFTPIAGKVPAYMAGRDDILRDMEEVIEGDDNALALISLFVGARGAGKTALLSYFANRAEESGWIAARVSCAPGMLDEIILRTERSARHLIDATPSRKLKSANIAKLGSLEWEAPEKTQPNWRLRMDDLLDMLEQVDTGLLITVDEVDSELSEMDVLVSSLQHFLDEGRSVALAMAGLSYGLSALLSGRATSFLRRAARYNLGAIGDYEVREALAATMEQGGKSFEPAALEKAVEAVGGFPYMLQLVGYRAWKRASRRDSVTLADVETAIEVARQELEDRVYEATWFDLTRTDGEFLYAMLADGEVTRQAGMPKRLGKTSGHVSKYKKRMLQEGIIQERSRGQMEFCLPGFREYLLQKKFEG